MPVPSSSCSSRSAQLKTRSAALVWWGSGGVLAAQIVDDLLLGRGGDAAPLETVVRQDADVLGNARGVEGGRGLRLGGGGRAQGGGKGQNGDGR